MNRNEGAADYRQGSVQQEAAALLQQESPGGGGEVLRAADGSPGGHPHRDHPPALQTAGEQTVGAFAQSAAVEAPTRFDWVTAADVRRCRVAKNWNTLSVDGLLSLWLSWAITVAVKDVLFPAIIWPKLFIRRTCVRDHRNATPLCTYALFCVLNWWSHSFFFFFFFIFKVFWIPSFDRPAIY